MIAPEAGIEVWRWTTREAERAELQVALRRVAERDRWAGVG